MSILNLYSRRKGTRENAGKADVYGYDEIPPKLRMQIVDIWRWTTGPVAVQGFVGDTNRTDSWTFWEFVAEAIRHEKA
jgi:hypothetical protein